jgi:hypothetical protein
LITQIPLFPFNTNTLSLRSSPDHAASLLNRLFTHHA